MWAGYLCRSRLFSDQKGAPVAEYAVAMAIQVDATPARSGYVTPQEYTCRTKWGSDNACLGRDNRTDRLDTRYHETVFHRIVLLLVAIVLILMAITAVILFSARRSLLAGVTELRSAQDQIQLVTVHSSLRSALGQVRGDIVQSRSNFQSADDRLSLVGPLVEHLGWIPQIGPEVAAAPHVAHAAHRTADGMLSLLDGLAPLASRWDATSGNGRVPALVAGLSVGRPDFDQACAQFDEAEVSRRALSVDAYPAALASALHSLDDRLPRLQIFCRLLALGPKLLGADRPISYLVAYQNSNELKATGGFIGSASVLTVRRGIASQLFEGSGIVDNLSVPPPEPVAYYNGEPAWLFRDSNWSPDFPTTAALERFFYALDFHHSVSNIVNVTPQAVSALLSATGPMYVPEYRQTVTAANVEGLADFYAHWASTPGPGTTGNLDTRKKQFIGIVARHMLQRVKTLSVRSMIDLGQAVGTSVERGDLLLNFRDPSLQSLVLQAGASHAVNPRHGDYLYVVNTNLSYNKINRFVHLSSAYDVHVRPDRWLDARLTVRIHNVPAPAAYKRDSIGPEAGRYGTWDDYATFLRIYTPPGAQLIDQTGWTQPWSQGPAYGGTMFSGYLIVLHGSTRTVRLHYVVPPNVFRASHGKAYTLLVPHQPGSFPDAVQVTLHHDGVRSAWKVLHPSLDVHISSPIEVRPFDPIPFPRYPPPATSSGGWVEPHAFLAPPKSRR